MSSSISTTFRVTVNSNKENIINTLEENFGGLKHTLRNKQVSLNKNFVVISLNEDYNPALAKTDEDGFLYFENNIDFYPIEDNLTLDKQISFAKKIIASFKAKRIQAELVSEFEYLI